MNGVNIMNILNLIGIKLIDIKLIGVKFIFKIF